MFDRGFYQLFRLRGIPVRVHWSAPVGAFVFGGLGLNPVFWLAFFVLIFIHELGHATLVWRFGHRVVSIDITGIGGSCRWVGPATAYQKGAVAWGGVLAQAILLAATGAVVLTLGYPEHPLVAQLANAFLFTNLWLLAFNLVPYPPFDGAEAWPFTRLLFARLRGGRTNGNHAEGTRKTTARPTRGRDASNQPPKSQAELGDVFAKIARDAERARKRP